LAGKECFILVGVPLPCDFRADARVISVVESWRSSGVITYYPATRSASEGQDKIVQMALHMTPRPTHILFMDYDVLPRNSTLMKLLEHDKDIVSGVYPILQKCEIKWCVSKEEPFNAIPINELPENPFKAKTISNGMMLVKTEVFDKLEWPYWKEEYGVGHVSLGADEYFFTKARKAGYDLWIDPKLKCNHFKTMDLLGMAFKYIKA